MGSHNTKMLNPDEKHSMKNNQESSKLATDLNLGVTKTILPEKKETDIKLKNAGKLFVGGLDFKTTSKQMEDHFSRFGNVADATVIRFPKSGKSRGFGFVTFAHPESAKKVLQTKYHVIDGKVVDVRYFDSKPPNSQNYRVFLGGLPADVKEEDLVEFFDRYGEVVNVLIPRDETTNQLKDFGFVRFKEESSMEHCIADKFVFLKGKKVQMKKANLRDDSHTNEASVVDNEIEETQLPDINREIQMNTPDEEQLEKKAENNRKLFVGGLKHDTTWEKLKYYFSQYGKVADATVIRFPKSGKSRGFGFVTFAHPESAKKVLQTKYHVIDGKVVDVRYFDSKPPNSQNYRVFLGGLPADVKEEDLVEFFDRYGEVVNVLIPRDETTNQLKDFGFVRFKEESSMEHCIADKFVFLKGKKVQMRKADSCESSQFLGALNTGLSNTYDPQEDKKTKPSEMPPNFKVLSTLFDLFNAMDIKKSQADDDIKKLENFLSAPSKHDKYEIENLIKFSGESSSEESECESSSSTLTSETSQTNMVSSETPDLNPNLDPALLLTFKDNAGCSKCSLCLCPLSDSSSECYLAHAATPGHKAKLKERFPQKGGLFQEAQKTDTTTKNSFTNQNPQANKKKPFNKHNVNNTEKKNLNMRRSKKAQKSLENGIQFIEVSGKELKCIKCGVTLPKSENFSNLMTNVLGHLGGKTHLKNVAANSSNLQTNTENANKKEKPKNTKQIEKKKSNVYITCLPCNLNLKTEVEFNSHKMSKTHSSSTDSEHKCRLCGKLMFGSRADFGEHYSNCLP